MVTKKIPTTMGKFAIVDESDYEELSKHKWHLKKVIRTNNINYYVRRTNRSGVGPSTIYMHRQLMGYKDQLEIDHINGNGLDNRRSNIRFCTKSQNMRNRCNTGKNKTGYKGVFQDKRLNHMDYIAHLRLGKILKQSRRFRSLIDAAKAYDKMALEHYGEFANINFPIKEYNQHREGRDE
jgi:hypothetical protein